MSNQTNTRNRLNDKPMQPIPHHSLKQIFDGLHDNMSHITYAIQHVVIYEELSDKDKDQICDAINELRQLLIELECDFNH